jgi:hypothetical protein
MTPKLSDDLCQAIKEQGGTPLYVVDPNTNDGYVLIRAEHYERIKSVTDGDGAEEMYPLLAEIEPDDWDDLSQYDRKP